MPKIVRIPGKGNVRFPDSMTDEQIASVIRNQQLAPEAYPAPSTAPVARSASDAQPKPLTALGQAEAVFPALWKKSNPVTQVQGMLTAARDLPGAGRALLEAQGELGMKAKESFERGDYGTAIRQGLHYLIPGLGPELESPGAKMEEGKYGEALGETLGIGTNLFLGPKVLGKSKGVPIVPKFGNLTPEVSSAITYLESEGVPLSAGVRTGNRYVGGVQGLTGYTPLGGVVAERAERATTEGLRRTSEKLAAQAHPVPVVAEQAGAELRGALGTKVENLAAQAEKHYNTLRAIEADPAHTRSVQVGVEKTPTGVKPIMQDVQLPVDVRAVKADLFPIYRHMSQWMEPARRNASPGYQAIKSILEGPDHVPASVAEAGLGGLKELSREGAGRSAGLAKFSIPKLQTAIDDAVGTADPAALAALRRGRATVAQQYTTKGVLDQLRTEPVQAFGQMTYAKDAGVDLLRRVAKEAPGELPKVGRAYLEDLFQTATAEGGFGRTQGLWQKWQNLGPETKKLLFKNPMLVDNLDKFMLGAKKIAESPNPSKSALVGSIIPGVWIINEPVSGISYTLGTGALAKLLYSPRGAKLLAEGMKIPFGKKSAIAAQILRIAGDDVQRLKAQPAY